VQFYLLRCKNNSLARDGKKENRGEIPGSGKERYFSSSEHSDRLSGPHKIVQSIRSATLSYDCN
jgi:hypothetical protein